MAQTIHSVVYYVILLSIYILAECGAAWKEGWAFKWQILQRPDPPKEFLSFWGNAANTADVLLFNYIAAYLLAVHATSWRLDLFVLIYVSIAIIGAFGYLEPLHKDSLTTPSALFRNGGSPLAGVMHQIYWTFGVSASLAFFLLTPRASVTSGEVWIITGLLMVHWAIAVMHPPYAVRGKIHAAAVSSTVAGWIALPLLACYLLYW